MAIAELKLAHKPTQKLPLASLPAVTHGSSCSKAPPSGHNSALVGSCMAGARRRTTCYDLKAEETGRALPWPL